MSEEPEFSQQERRRQSRYDFVSNCLLTVKSPAWAIAKKPLRGCSENINQNGMRINDLTIDEGTADLWQQAIRSDEELQMVLIFPQFDELSSLRGECVWIHREDPLPEPMDGAVYTYSVGVIFHILGRKQRRALQSLIDSLR